MDDDIKFAANERKVNGLQDRVLAVFLIQQIVECIVYDILDYTWHCSSCKAAGVTRCGLVDSSVMNTRAVVNHLLSDAHYKFAAVPIKALIDEYKSMYLVCFEVVTANKSTVFVLSALQKTKSRRVRL